MTSTTAGVKQLQNRTPDRNKIHCGQCGKYLKNQLHKHLLVGEMLNRFLRTRAPQKPHSIHLNIYVMSVNAIIKENVLK